MVITGVERGVCSTVISPFVSTRSRTRFLPSFFGTEASSALASSCKSAMVENNRPAVFCLKNSAEARIRAICLSRR